MPPFNLPNLPESDPIAFYAGAALATAVAGAVLWRFSRGRAMLAGTVAALALWGGVTSWAIATLPPPAAVATEATVAELAAQVALLSAELRTLNGGDVSTVPTEISAAVPGAVPEQAPAPMAGVVAGPEPAPTPGATSRPSAARVRPEEPEPERPPLIATTVPRRGVDTTGDVPPDRSAVFAHVVVQGDRLAAIARLYLPPDRERTEFADQIALLNGIDDPAVVTIGRTLWIPAQ